MSDFVAFADFVREAHRKLELDPAYEIGSTTSAAVLTAYLKRAYDEGQHAGREAVALIMLNMTSDENRSAFAAALAILKATPLGDPTVPYGWTPRSAT